ncbi:MAG TPA: hypothetical protein VLC92_09570 [Rhodocyclaceae bacterium]|nr:hypothetical protein [Rhodocyclaceae bacterium]
MNDQPQANDWYRVEDFAARHPNLFPSVTSLRYQMRSRQTNGLAKAVVRLGRNTLISETKFMAWLEEQAEGK